MNGVMDQDFFSNQGGVHDGVVHQCTRGGHDDDIIVRNFYGIIPFIFFPRKVSETHHFSDIHLGKGGELGRVL